VGKLERTILPVTAVILAGGESTRMAAPKAFLKVGGLTIIEREVRALGSVFSETLIVARDPAAFAGLGPRVVLDSPEFGRLSGPMLGLYSGLLEAKNGSALVVGCDMPFISPGLAGWLAGLIGGHDMVIPRVGGYPEPLFGVYSKGVLPVLSDALKGGVRRLQDVFGLLDVLYVDEGRMRPLDPDLKSFINVNTPADLMRAEAIAKSGV